MRHVRISEDMGLTDFTQIEQNVLSAGNTSGLVQAVGDHSPEMDGFGFGPRKGKKGPLAMRHLQRRKKMMGGKKKKSGGAEPAETPPRSSGGGAPYGAPYGGAPSGGGAPDGGAPDGGAPDGGAPSGGGAPDGGAPSGGGAPDGGAPSGGGAPDGGAPEPSEGGEEGGPEGEGAPEGAAPVARPSSAPARAPNGAPASEGPAPTTVAVPEHVGPSAALLQAGDDEKPWLKWALIGGGVLAVGLIVYFLVIKKK